MLKNFSIGKIKEFYIKSKMIFNKLSDWTFYSFKTENNAVE